MMIVMVMLNNIILMMIIQEHEGTHILQSLDGFAISLASDGRYIYVIFCCKYGTFNNSVSSDGRYT